VTAIHAYHNFNFASVREKQSLAKAGGAGNESRSGDDTSTECAELECDGADEPMKHLKNINYPKDEHGAR
jgi:hypothetical protein